MSSLGVKRKAAKPLFFYNKQLPRRVRARAVERSGTSAFGVQARNIAIIFRRDMCVAKNTARPASAKGAQRGASLLATKS